MLKRYKRIPRKRSKPRRKMPEWFGGHGIRLHGKAKEARRAEIFERAGGLCEDIVETGSYRIGRSRIVSYGLCRKPATEWSHKRHGSYRCDCMECGIASCRECHRKRHGLRSAKIA